ncbi:MAG: ribosome-associated translation inhibitor RaiA [Pseudomonadota bacterium]|nr:ribosome-associated translation inhibitor RaiA [Pseudomonadota bacterium]
MSTQVNGKQIDIGSSLRSFVEEKTADLVEKYSKPATDISVTFSKDRHEYFCDISMHLSTGIMALSKGKANDIYESFDSSLDKIAKQLRRYKRRLKSHHIDRKEPIQFYSANSYVISNVQNESEHEEKESLKPLIIAEMETKIPKLSVGEAVMQMELAGSNMLIFRNSSDDKINVVHIRDDGNIGWVDPEHTK